MTAGCGGGATSEVAVAGPGGAAARIHIAAPEALALDTKGNLYLSEFDGNRVDRVAPDGTLEVVAGTGSPGFSGDGGPAVEAELNAPAGLVATEEGSLLVVDHHNDRIRIVGPDGEIDTLGASSEAGLSDPIGIDLADDGSIYVADELNGRVRRIDRSGNVDVFAGGGRLSPGDGGPATKAALRHPSHLVLDGAGDLVFADFLDNRIRKVDPNGVITTIAGTGEAGFGGDGGAATAAELDFPTGVVVDAAGNVCLSDAHNNRVRKIDRDGVITTVAGSGLAGFGGDGGPATAAKLNAPAGLAFDGAGNLYVADQGNNRVRRVDLDGVITTIVGRG